MALMGKQERKPQKPKRDTKYGQAAKTEVDLQALFQESNDKDKNKR
jgi:hypothetical protein